MAIHTGSVRVIGGGLSGCEAAWQLAEHGFSVRLFEMKPLRFSPAHENPSLCELVCSNSFKAMGLGQASGLLQREMARLGSLVMDVAAAHRVPAGQALAVDRARFARSVTERLEGHPRVEVVREEVVDLGEEATVVATGPLTSPSLTNALGQLTGTELLYFYDAMAPIVEGGSIDREAAFFGSRYGKGGEEDYLNCPLTAAQFDLFYQELTRAETVPTKSFEEERVFQACQPIEVLAARGAKTLLFGPMKPVGLDDPATGRRPFAVVQLRREDSAGQRWNLVGCQTKLTHREQERVFRLIPALAHAEFHRLGSLHRNTFVDGPRLLDRYLRLRKAPWIQLAGQLTGVEGYLESAATGLWAGRNLALRLEGRTPDPLPEETAVGALAAHASGSPARPFEPMNVNFGLLPPLGIRVRDKAKVKEEKARRALEALEGWLERWA